MVKALSDRFARVLPRQLRRDIDESGIYYDMNATRGITIKAHAIQHNYEHTDGKV